MSRWRQPSIDYLMGVDECEGLPERPLREGLQLPGLSGQSGLSLVYLNPGQVLMTDKPTIVSTVLGSCVSVTMFHATRSYGAICHGMLPDCNGRDCYDCAEKLKYVDCCVTHMARHFERVGIGLRGLDVKLFGGAEVLPCGSKGRRRDSVGKQNIEAAHKILSQLGLTPSVTDTGGANGRKILFYTHSGDVYLKRLRRQIL
ncbi:chemotaxis protein CheD [Candidatus Magnetobacterium casense]|uniref:chemotaxis protein CheD n=1 Tax=Candidatus Magnetobacterium casense TaxID=1455061 RepID=UPI0012DE1D27|nr:chemotaxis protein CheD [Candidatus Magnetobacterium casensis]